MNDVTALEVHTFPKSVQPGVPRLMPPKPGWRTVKLGDVLYPIVRPVKLWNDQEYRLVTVKRSRGGIEERRRLAGRQIAVKSQFEIKGGDFLISKRQIVHGACAVVSDDFDGSIVSNEYSVLGCAPELDMQFLKYLSHSVYFQQTCFHSSIGVHVEKMIFKLEKWLDWKVNIPSLDEQRRIAAFLGSVDQKIESLRAKETGLRKFKAGLMQKIFSQELRFKRDDGSDYQKWMPRRLDQICSFYKGTGLPKSEISLTGRIPCIHYGDLFVKYGAKISAVDTFTDSQDGFFGRAGDVLMPSSDVTPDGLCKASALDVEGIRVGGDIIVLRPSTEINSFWLAFAILSDKERIIKIVSGTTVKHIYARDIGKLTLMIPHPDEQRKIADAISALDVRIDTARNQIARMEIFKKGLLQQMFV